MELAPIFLTYAAVDQIFLLRVGLFVAGTLTLAVLMVTITLTRLGAVRGGAR